MHCNVMIRAGQSNAIANNWLAKFISDSGLRTVPGSNALTQSLPLTRLAVSQLNGLNVFGAKSV